MPSIESFDEDLHADRNGYGDDDSQDAAPVLRIAERPSCIECYPANCTCGIAQVDWQAEPLTLAA